LTARSTSRPNGPISCSIDGRWSAPTRIGRPDDMAGVVVFLSSQAGSYVDGPVIAGTT
jgi:NAD(P)-dependent dehydrogenase (short-subunit alcohol dehydrogenase family)